MYFYRNRRVLILAFMSVNIFSFLLVIKYEIELSYSRWETNPVNYEHEYYGLPESVLCLGKGIAPNQTFIRQEFDPMDIKPVDYLPDYKNPCFIQTKKKQEVVRCLPYFYLVGMPKSGTTDLWFALNYHPDVTLLHTKENFWFTLDRFSIEEPYSKLLDVYKASTREITKRLSPCQHHEYLPYHHVITGEGFVDISFDNDRWTTFKGNENCNEPVILNQHHIHHMYPKAKIIFMMRNPVDRVFSDYLFESRFVFYNKSLEDFHVDIVRSLYRHNDCRKYFTLRGCAYNHSLESYKARLRVGMYHIFIEDWLRVFPREQFVFIRFEDYINDPIKELNKILKLLDLRPFSKEEIANIMKRKIQNRRTQEDEDMGDMFPFTRKLLEDFYQPFNEKLAYLLKDKRYFWNETTLS